MGRMKYAEAIETIISDGMQVRAIMELALSMQAERDIREYKIQRIARINAAGAQNEEIDELCMSCGDTPEKRREGK